MGMARRPPVPRSPEYSARRYGGSFQVETPERRNRLDRPGTTGAATHAFDMEQRFVGLSFTAGAGVLNVTAPPNGNIAPPGYYMLFILNPAGVPSVARFVRLTSLANQPPAATITSPAGNVTRNPGGSVSFAGSGTDPDGTISAYSWTFPGGNPASSSVAARQRHLRDARHLRGDAQGDGQRRPREPGRDADHHDLGLLPDGHSVIASDTARSEPSYTATVAPVNGFTGTVAFSVTGFPRNVGVVQATLSHPGSGSTTLSVVHQRRGTPGGSYPLTISRNEWNTDADGPR